MQFGPSHSAPRAISSYFASSSRDCSNQSGARLFKSVLHTALVNVSTGNTSQVAKVLFDEGEEISLISNKLARTLDAKLVFRLMELDLLPLTANKLLQLKYLL